MGPFGIMNPAPIFWTRKCKILQFYQLNGGHLKMTLNDGTSSINAIKWNNSLKIKNNDLIDIAFHIEMNRWKKTNNLQLNIIDMKVHRKIIDLQIHNSIYKCQLTNNNKILITNSNGDCISSDYTINSNYIDQKQAVFAKKILSFAEIALGRVT